MNKQQLREAARAMRTTALPTNSGEQRVVTVSANPPQPPQTKPSQGPAIPEEIPSKHTLAEGQYFKLKCLGQEHESQLKKVRTPIEESIRSALLEHFEKLRSEYRKKLGSLVETALAEDTEYVLSENAYYTAINECLADLEESLPEDEAVFALDLETRTWSSMKSIDRRGKRYTLRK